MLPIDQTQWRHQTVCFGDNGALRSQISLTLRCQGAEALWDRVSRRALWSLYKLLSRLRRSLGDFVFLTVGLQPNQATPFQNWPKNFDDGTLNSRQVAKFPLDGGNHLLGCKCPDLDLKLSLWEKSSFNPDPSSYFIVGMNKNILYFDLISAL